MLGWEGWQLVEVWIWDAAPSSPGPTPVPGPSFGLVQPDPEPCLPRCALPVTGLRSSDTHAVDWPTLQSHPLSPDTGCQPVSECPPSQVHCRDMPQVGGHVLEVGLHVNGEGRGLRDLPDYLPASRNAQARGKELASPHSPRAGPEPGCPHVRAPGQCKEAEVVNPSHSG